MDPRMYPTGNVVQDANNALSYPDANDKLDLIRGDSTPKNITLAALLRNLPTLGLKPEVYTAAGTIEGKPTAVHIQNATPGTPITLAMEQHGLGQLTVISRGPGSGVISVRVAGRTDTGATNDGITLLGDGATAILYGASLTRFVLLASIGTVSVANV